MLLWRLWGPILGKVATCSNGIVPQHPEKGRRYGASKIMDTLYEITARQHRPD